MIIDFGEEKKRRRRYATLNDLMAEAMQHLRHVGVHAEGIFFVMKVPGSDGPQYQYLQEGFTPWDLENLLTTLIPSKAKPSSSPETKDSSGDTSTTPSLGATPE